MVISRDGSANPALRFGWVQKYYLLGLVLKMYLRII